MLKQLIRTVNKSIEVHTIRYVDHFFQQVKSLCNWLLLSQRFWSTIFLVRPLLVTPDDTVVPCAFERVLAKPKEVATKDSSPVCKWNQ